MVGSLGRQSRTDVAVSEGRRTHRSLAIEQFEEGDNHSGSPNSLMRHDDGRYHDKRQPRSKEHQIRHHSGNGKSEKKNRAKTCGQEPAFSPRMQPQWSNPASARQWSFDSDQPDSRIFHPYGVSLTDLAKESRQRWQTLEARLQARIRDKQDLQHGASSSKRSRDGAGICPAEPGSRVWSARLRRNSQGQADNNTDANGERSSNLAAFGVTPGTSSHDEGAVVNRHDGESVSGHSHSVFYPVINDQNRKGGGERDLSPADAGPEGDSFYEALLQLSLERRVRENNSRPTFEEIFLRRKAESGDSARISARISQSLAGLIFREEEAGIVHGGHHHLRVPEERQSAHCGEDFAAQRSAKLKKGELFKSNRCGEQMTTPADGRLREHSIPGEDPRYPWQRRTYVSQPNSPTMRDPSRKGRFLRSASKPRPTLSLDESVSENLSKQKKFERPRPEDVAREMHSPSNKLKEAGHAGGFEAAVGQKMPAAANVGKKIGKSRPQGAAENFRTENVRKGRNLRRRGTESESYTFRVGDQQEKVGLSAVSSSNKSRQKATSDPRVRPQHAKSPKSSPAPPKSGRAGAPSAEVTEVGNVRLARINHLRVQHFELPNFFANLNAALIREAYIGQSDLNVFSLPDLLRAGTAEVFKGLCFFQVLRGCKDYFFLGGGVRTEDFLGVKNLHDVSYFRVSFDHHVRMSLLRCS